MTTGAYQTSNFAYQGSGLFAYQDVLGEVIPEIISGGGNWNLLKKKKKPVRIKYSDFDTQEKYAAAVAAAAMPIARITDISEQVRPQAEPIDEDDDDLIIKTLIMRMFDA